MHRLLGFLCMSHDLIPGAINTVLDTLMAQTSKKDDEGRALYAVFAHRTWFVCRL